MEKIKKTSKQKIVDVIYNEFKNLTYLDILELSNLLQASIIRSFREAEKNTKTNE